jgi:hypothetical protein
VGWAARELIASGVVDEILIGDPFASAQELEDLQQACILSGVGVDGHRSGSSLRGGAEDHVWRQPRCPTRPVRLGDPFHTSREMAGKGEKVAAREPLPRLPYAITIDNEKYGRYSGELQIVRRALPADERVNVVGKIAPQDTGLLRYIAAARNFDCEK